MSITLIVTFSLLIIVAYLGKRFSSLPKNIWLLFLAQPLASSAVPLIVLSGSLLSAKMAPNPEWITLPLALTIVGTASGVVPASMLMKKIGRKRGTIVGLLIAICGALLATQAAIINNFSLLIVGSFLIGISMAFVAQLRFAALESLSDAKQNPKAISVLMASGLFSAVLGPEIAINAKDWIDSPFGYAGSFFSLALLFVCALLIISRLDPTHSTQQSKQQATRKLSAIVFQPLFIIALSSSAIGYAVMSYVMTASPLSMHEFHSHDLQTVKWVVQSHILAMYLPSLISATLIKYIGINKLMTIGSLLYGIVVIVAISGHSMLHYWWVMVLLGLGWNFLFTSGTLLLPDTYQSNERFKVQAVHDFCVFFIQAVVSLSAGVILFSQGWTILVSITVPLILMMLMVSLWFYKLRQKSNNLSQEII